MVSRLVDSSIVIDILRGYSEAHTWFDQQPIMSISRITWIEVIQGTKNAVSQQRSLKLLRLFNIIETETSDVIVAADLMLAWHLKLNIDLADCLLCATVLRLQVPFYTRNLKHFSPILGSLSSSPY